MRILFSVLGVVLVFYSVLGQVEKHVHWKYEVDKKVVEVGDEVELIFRAKIDEGWYMYSSDYDPDNFGLGVGPTPASFVFDKNGSFEILGEIKAIDSKSKYDSIFEGTYTYFKKYAEFRQKIKVLKKSVLIKGELDYQVCQESGLCVPGGTSFFFDQILVNDKQSGFVDTIKIIDQNETLTQDSIKKDSIKTEEEKEAVYSKDKEGIDFTKQSENSPYSLLVFMLVAFFSGLAALLTPCVFPMIPMTVTFFTGQAGGGNGKRSLGKALFYGGSIIGVYTLIGVIASRINGPSFANELSTNWIPNVFFSAIFVVFALSFLGMFEIQLPSKWVNRVDREADKGGYYGVFFMALTLVIVSFSCTGPIAASILFESAGGEVLKPVLGMFAHALAFAIPFVLFAIFPQWLNKLPKSGGWLNTVKVMLGFIELGLALKFMSTADQAYHWGILDREVYIAIWIVILVFMGLNLLGKIRLPHDSIIEKVGVLRVLFTIFIFSFVVYLIPGMFGAPLKSLAGYLPPSYTHDFDLKALIKEGAYDKYEVCDEPKYKDFLHLPHGIQGYFDYEQALSCAREQRKPLFIDFTGHGCVNCREMEARVWSHPEVLKRLKNDYVVVALYVDDKTVLPDSLWYTSKNDGRLKNTIGKINADFQISRFDKNAQPYYVLLDQNEELLVEKPMAYNLDVTHFVEYLDKGIENFKNKKDSYKK